MKPAHNLVDTAMTTAVRNGLKIAGFDVYRVHFDRPLTPDAAELLGFSEMVGLTTITQPGKRPQVHIPTAQEVKAKGIKRAKVISTMRKMAKASRKRNR